MKALVLALLLPACGIANAVSGADLNTPPDDCTATIGATGACTCTGNGCACVDDLNCRCTAPGCSATSNAPGSATCAGPGCACDEIQCLCEGTRDVGCTLGP